MSDGQRIQYVLPLKWDVEVLRLLHLLPDPHAESAEVDDDGDGVHAELAEVDDDVHADPLEAAGGENEWKQITPSTPTQRQPGGSGTGHGSVSPGI